MIYLKRARQPIEIRLNNPGVYIFPSASATGKTYLYSVLKKLSDVERVDALTFDNVKIIDPLKLFDRERVDLVMLDRYDMYFGEFMDEMQEFSKTGIVLVACKAYNFPFQVESCGIHLRKDKLLVLGN